MEVIENYMFKDQMCNYDNLKRFILLRLFSVVFKYIIIRIFDYCYCWFFVIVVRMKVGSGLVILGSFVQQFVVEYGVQGECFLVI